MTAIFNAILLGISRRQESSNQEWNFIAHATHTATLFNLSECFYLFRMMVYDKYICIHSLYSKGEYEGFH